jgi:hypothetical protein
LTEGIWVAVIAAGASWVGIVLTNWFIARQAANDLRSNIDRDIAIVKKLRPGSEEVRVLEAHISHSINVLIVRETRRQANSGTFVTTGIIIGTSVVLYALDVWRRHEVPEFLRAPVEVIYWALWLFYGLIFVSSVVRFVSASKSGVKLGYWKTRLVYTKFRLAWWKRKHKRAKPLLDAKLNENRAILQWALNNKDALIAEVGQDQYDANNLEVMRLIEVGEELQKQFVEHQEAADRREEESG